MKEFVEKLIERLEEYQYTHLWEHDSEECLHCQENEDDWCSCRNCHVCLLDKVKKIVKQLAEEYNQYSTKNNQGWIPCSERLPDTDEYIFLSFENCSTPAIGRYEEDEEGGAFYIGDDDESCIFYGLFANAWQPLPKPYKQEEQEKV